VIEEGDEQILFRVVVVMEQGLALRALVGDILHRHVGVAVGAERAIDPVHDLVGRARLLTH